MTPNFLGIITNNGMHKIAKNKFIFANTELNSICLKDININNPIF